MAKIKKEKSVKAVNDVYKNAHIAMQSISDLLPQVKDAELKKELKTEYSSYEKFIEGLTEFMKSSKIEPKDINFLQKAFMWSSIKIKTLFNRSRTKIAEMMILGTVMGITELTAMHNEGKTLQKDVAEKVDELLNLEEDFEKRLKTFL